MKHVNSLEPMQKKNNYKPLRITLSNPIFLRLRKHKENTWIPYSTSWTSCPSWNLPPKPAFISIDIPNWATIPQSKTQQRSVLGGGAKSFNLETSNNYSCVYFLHATKLLQVVLGVSKKLSIQLFLDIYQWPF